MPHKCGPLYMGVGWREEIQSEVKIRSWSEKVPFVDQIDFELCDQNAAEDKSTTIVVGNYNLNLEDFKNDEGNEETEETKQTQLVKSKFFKDEVLEGQRKPNMIERLGFGTDPDAGKYLRLEMENFKQVDFRYPAKLVWCGTSVSGGSLDEAEVSRQTRFQVKKVKAFTVTFENAKKRPELNALSVLQEQITDESLVVVECGVNDVTNIFDESENMDRLASIDLKMRELVSIAAFLKKKHKLERVILLQRIPRLDEKSQLSLFSNQAMLRAVVENTDPHGIIVQTLHLSGSKESLFGVPGVRNTKGQFPDGLHLRGLNGRVAFTEAAIEMLRSC